jgi:hypothetical protein
MSAAALVLALLLADEKEAAESLSKFNAAFKAKEVDARVAAVEELAKIQHEKVYTKLGSLLLTDVREVRIAAAKGLGGAEEHKKKVTNYFLNGFLANAADLTVEAAIIESLEKLQTGLGRAALESYFKAADIATAKVAIETAGELRKKEYIGSLIELAKWLEQTAKEYLSAGPKAKGFVGKGLPGDQGTTVDSEAPKRHKALAPVIDKVLSALTGQKLSTPQEWDDWWRKNGSSFKFP